LGANGVLLGFSGCRRPPDMRRAIAWPTLCLFRRPGPAQLPT
jgi:hypothetical protein